MRNKIIALRASHSTIYKKILDLANQRGSKPQRPYCLGDSLCYVFDLPKNQGQKIHEKTSRKISISQESPDYMLNGFKPTPTSTYALQCIKKYTPVFDENSPFSISQWITNKITPFLKHNSCYLLYLKMPSNSGFSSHVLSFKDHHSFFDPALGATPVKISTSQHLLEALTVVLHYCTQAHARTPFEALLLFEKIPTPLQAVTIKNDPFPSLSLSGKPTTVHHKPPRTSTSLPKLGKLPF